MDKINVFTKVLRWLKALVKSLLKKRIRMPELVVDRDLLLISRSYPNIVKDLVLPYNYLAIANELYLTIYLPLKQMYPDIKILSWYRDKVLNALVGGVVRSDHLFGAAFDFWVPGKNIHDIFHANTTQQLFFRQLILCPNLKFIHVSINHEHNNFKHEFFVNEW